MLKNVRTVLAVAFMGITAAACSMLEKEIEVHQDLTFYLDLAENASPEFSIITDKDTRDDDIEKYKDNIKDSGIDKITFTVSDYEGDGVSLSADLSYAAEGAASFNKVGSISNVNLADLNASGEEVVVNITSESDKNELKQMIMDGNIISFRLEGTTTSTPLVARLKFRIYSPVTVGI